VLLHPNNNWRRIQTLTLMTVQLYPSASYFISLAIQRLFLFGLLLTIYVNRASHIWLDAADLPAKLNAG
jgi:hypothetical protein